MTPSTERSQLISLSERLLQNIQLYFGLSRRLTRIRLGIDSRPGWEIETAMVESFALHTRGLSEFFFRRDGSRDPRKANDAWALHYFDPPERWSTLVGRPGPWLRQIYVQGAKNVDHVDRFGTHVAHLTYHSVPESDLARGWPVMQLAHNVGLAVMCFARNVDSGKVSPEFCRIAESEVPVSARLDQAMLMPLLTWTRPLLRQVPR